MNFMEFVQTTSAVAGITMILMGSRWLKQYLRIISACCPLNSEEEANV